MMSDAAETPARELRAGRSVGAPGRKFSDTSERGGAFLRPLANGVAGRSLQKSSTARPITHPNVAFIQAASTRCAFLLKWRYGRSLRECSGN